MTDERGPVTPGNRDGGGWVLFGALLVLLGLFFAARSLDLLPWPVMEVIRTLSRASFGIGLVVLGIALIVWAQKGHALPKAPGPGRRLYRSRDEKWVAGVLGGLAEYFGIDVTLLRLAFIGLLVIGQGGLVFAYIVMAIVVPYAPFGTAGQQPPAA